MRLKPGRTYRFYYRVTGVFEVLTFGKEEIQTAFAQTRKALPGVGLSLAGKGIDFSESRMDFSLYITTERELTSELFNSKFLDFANKAGWPDISYEVHYVSMGEVGKEGIPQPEKGGMFAGMEKWFKWGLIGIGVVYLAPIANKLLRGR